VDSAFRCDPDIQAGLVANLVVMGGNSSCCSVDGVEGVAASIDVMLMSCLITVMVFRLYIYIVEGVW